MNSEKGNWPQKLWKQAVKRMEQMRLEIFGAYEEREMKRQMTLRPVEVRRPEDVRKVRGTQNQNW